MADVAARARVLRTDEEDSIRHLGVYKAALKGEWDDGLELRQLTALHIAVSTGHGTQFVDKLVEKLEFNSLKKKDVDGDTALHYAAIAGNLEAAQFLVGKNADLLLKKNRQGLTALHRAAQYSHRKVVSYLSTATLNRSREAARDAAHNDGHPNAFGLKNGVRLVNFLIIAGFYDTALEVLREYPNLAINEDVRGISALRELAGKPQAFRSHLGCWKRFFYDRMNFRENEPPNGRDVENQREAREESTPFYCFGFLGRMYETKKIHKQAEKLLRFLIDEALLLQDSSKLNHLLAEPLHVAGTLGIHEFVEEIIKAYPDSVWIGNQNRQKVFHFAVLHRQEKVFNVLLHQMSSYKHFLVNLSTADGNNLLHIAGKLVPSNKISGAALQMQRELQWFKEVEKVVPPSYREVKNKDGKTPREVFTEEHEDLIKKGEKWMKVTASSYSVVAALIVTSSLAAAYTVPGGRNPNDGIPILLNDTSFLIFQIANTFSLSSSVTSLLMFLGILTSRFTEEDFLKDLPIKLSIGLITLFFSIASMLLAFSSSLYSILHHRATWIPLALGPLAALPAVISFVSFQFSLFFKILYYTCGPSIFRKQSDQIIM